MPDFGHAFSGLAADRKLTHEELVRAVRFMVAAEYEAVQLYTQLAESIDNELAKIVLADIANEELVHAGEFMTLLQQLAPEEQAFYEKGRAEVDEMMGSLSPNVTTEEPTRAGETESEPSRLAVTVGSLLGS